MFRSLSSENSLSGVLVRLFLALLVVTVAAFGQGTTGGVDVTVTDSSGSTVPGAKVTALNTGTGAQLRVQTDNGGRAQFPLLRVGTYNVTVEQQGFEKLVREGVIVNATDIVHLDLKLSVGAVTQTMTVEATSPLLQTEHAVLGQVVEQRQITGTPLATRNFTQLLGTGAGVQGSLVNADNPGTGGANVSVNGGRNGSNSLMVDGAPSDNVLNLAPDGDGTPSIEFLSEFKILSHDYGAEFGRALGSVINVTTKSGTNQLHGEAYEFLRNKDLSARPFFSATDGENTQNQFGANVGGPIIKNKTFFFGGWESSRQRNANSGSSTIAAVVPTADQRAGNFGSKVIVDPATGNPFVNNTIPASQLSSTALALQSKLIPLPNYNSGGATDFFAAQVVPTDINEYTIRVDHRFNDNNLIWGRWFDSYEHDLAPFGQGFVGFGSLTHRNKHEATANYTHIFTPSLILENSVAWNQTDQYLQITDRTNFQSVGLHPLPVTETDDGLPQIAISNYMTLGNVQGWADHVKTGTARSDLTYTNGRHNIKIGAEARPDLYDDANKLNNRGVFNFTGTASGDAYADFLLGYTRSKVFGAGPGRIQNRDFGAGFYVSDQWRMSDRLTITMGVRYEPYWQPVAYNFDRTNWYPDLYTGVGSLASAGIVQANHNGINGSTVHNDMNNFMPRLGIAYRFMDKWVVRTGAGLYYDQRTGQIAQQGFQNSPGYTSVNIDCSVAGSGCSLKSPDNFTFVDPGYSATALAYPTSPTQAINYAAIERNTKTDNAWQWNFTVQRQLPGDTIVEAAYVGTKGTHLMGNYVGNPFIPVGFNPANPQPGPLVPEYPGLGLNLITGQGASSNYNALQITVKKRVASGTLIAAYTKSKTMSDGVDSSTRFYTTMGLAPWWDWSRAWGPSDFDRPQRLSITFSQDLPKHIQAPVAKYLLNNWIVNGMWVVQSGTPLSVTNATSGQGLGGADSSPTAALYSNVVAGATLINPGSNDSKVNNYINKAAFSKAPTGTVGDSGRNIVRGPGQGNLDFSIFREFPIRERSTLEFRSEFFNLTNHPNFGNPNTSMDSASFGQISTTLTNARIIQFALKLMF
jgi:outer membrane receptor protein involved in Fe transport